MESLISVIVPVYNTGKYVLNCIQSIINQTYKDLEIIIVDDGSNDNTRDIVSLVEDDRITYIYQENQGVSAARNNGLEHSKGDYITFIDSDDTIFPEMYEILLNLAEKNKADIAHCSYNRVTEGGGKPIGNTNKKYIFEGEDSVSALLRGNLFTGGVWNKLYRRELVDNIRFDETIKINEDVLFNFYAFRNSVKTVFIDRCLYNYNIVESSSCINTNRIKSAEDVFNVGKIIYESSFDKKYKNFAYNRYLNALCCLYRTYIYDGDKNQKKKCKFYKKKIIKAYNRKEFIGNLKINAFIIKYFSILYKPFYSIYNKIRKPNWDI